MSIKSFLATFFWAMLGVFLIAVAVFYSAADAGKNYFLRDSLLILMLLLTIVLFVFLPSFLAIRVIKDWGKNNSKTQQGKYFKRANNGIGLFMLTNCLLGFYLFANIDKIYHDFNFLSFYTDPAIILGGTISSSFLLYGSYYLAKSKGQSGWLALLLEFFYPIGLIILLMLPNKYKDNS